MRLGLYEERTRITFYLPEGRPDEAKAVASFITYLRSKRGTRRGHGRITGFTRTRTFPHPYEGWWWSTTRQRWVRDPLAVVVIDHELPIGDQRCQDQIDEFKQTAAKCYADAGRPQEEIWVVAHPIWRQD